MGAGNDDLHPLLASINETIANLREDVRELIGEITKIKELVERGFTDLRDAIHENIRAQAELKVMEYLMEVRSARAKLEAKNEQIENENAELEEKLDQIGERYAERHRELNQEARDRIRDVGEHIFELREDEFEDGIKTPIFEQAAPVFANLQHHAADVGERREAQVREETTETVDTIDDFVNRQNELLEDLERHRHDPADVGLDAVADDGEVTHLQFPFYVVNYRVDGMESRQVVVPSTVVHRSESESAWTTAGLQPLSGVDELMGEVPGLDPAASTTTETQAPTGDILGAAGWLERETTLGPSYSEVLESILPDQIPLYKEGASAARADTASDSASRSPDRRGQAATTRSRSTRGER